VAEWLGYRWLSEKYGVQPVQAFRTESVLAGSRFSEQRNNYIREHYPSVFKPAATLADHLTFALKHEGVHLEFLARLFDVIPKAELEAWIVSEPTGQYARRAGFFYELITDRSLEITGIGGNYVNALDESLYLTATQVRNVPRWRIRDNLPGSRTYCPQVMLTDRVQQASRYDCAKHLQELQVEFGADILLRSAVWLSIKESRASFEIEHEEQHVDRIKRFAAVMEQRCGTYDDPLSEQSLTDLQRHILGPLALRYGLRRSPVFVGESDRGADYVHYIAPHWKEASELLHGLRTFVARTSGAAPLLRAAVISFGFVYIHPLSDGNGRVSRFLINDILRRDNAIPPPFILPISATITSTIIHRRSYDDVLEVFSKPFMRRYADAWEFGDEQVAEDGVPYNLQFSAYQDALPAWRYPDLTEHVEYLAQLTQETIAKEMRSEAVFLRSLRKARESIKQVVEGPDADIDRIVRSIRENGKVSNKLLKDFPLLNTGTVAEQVVAAVHESFSSSADKND
jgi:hypothetical protein